MNKHKIMFFKSTLYFFHLELIPFYYCIGYISDNELLNNIKDCGAKVEVLGDASEVSNLQNAVWSAYESAMNI